MKNLYIALIEVLGDSIVLMEAMETKDQLLVQLNCNFNLDHSNALVNRFKELQPESYLDIEEGLGEREYLNQSYPKKDTIETICIKIKHLYIDTGNLSAITLSPETRKNIAELDTMLQTLKEDLEDNYPIDPADFDPEISQLSADIEDMQHRISIIQSEQDWI